MREKKFNTILMSDGTACHRIKRSYLALKIKGLNLWLFHDCRYFQHFTAGVADTEMNDISSPCSSLASRILWLHFHRAFFFSGVGRSVAEFTAVPCSSLVLPAQ